MKSFPKRPELLQSSEWKLRIGRSLFAARTIKSLTQAVLGSEAGVDWTTISKLERGETAPDLATIEALADALGLPIDNLIGRQSPWENDETGESGSPKTAELGLGSGATVAGPGADTERDRLLGLRIQKEREALGLSIESAVEKTKSAQNPYGLSATRWRGAEQGHMMAEIERMMMARALGLREDAFLDSPMGGSREAMADFFDSISDVFTSFLDHVADETLPLSARQEIESKLEAARVKFDRALPPTLEKR